MKILQFRGEFTDNGPGTQSLTIAEELHKRGHIVEFCASGGILKNKIESKGFTFYTIEESARTKRSFFNLIRATIKLSSLIKRNKYDVIHTHNAASTFVAYFAILISNKRKKVKLFRSCRGVELRKKYQWRNWIYKIYPAHIFVVCKFTKRELLSFGVPEQKITISYNGVNLKRFDITKKPEYRNQIRSELNIPLKATVIGIIGRMGIKGHEKLIRAFGELYNLFPNLYLVLVGAGDPYNNLVELSQKLMIHDRTIFTGFRTDSEKLNAAFDIFTLLSTKGEMFPNAILESMAMANPFVASNLSGIPELVENQEGILTEPGNVEDIVNKLKYILENPKLANKMGNNGRKTVINRFTITEVVNIIENEYKK